MDHDLKRNSLENYFVSSIKEQKTHNTHTHIDKNLICKIFFRLQQLCYVKVL